MGKRTTTTRHKNDNTFRFQGQKEKERKIIVNRLGSIRDWLREDDDEEQLSSLYKAMLHWQDLNLYVEFSEVLSEIGGDVKSLAQVLHQKEEIKETLISKISPDSAGFLDGIFGLLTAFVSDLRQEFVPYLPATLNALTDLILSTSKTEVIAMALDCYSRLLMDLKTAVIKEFNFYFKIFQRLFGSKVKDFIVQCAGKSISFICSKVCKTNSLLFCRRIQRSLEGSKDGQLDNGIAVLLHQIISSDLVLKNSLDLARLIGFVDQIDSDISKWEALLCKLLEKILSQKKRTKEMIATVYQEVEKALTPELFEKQFSYCIHLLQILFENSDASVGSEIRIKFAKFLIANPQLWRENPSGRKNVTALLCSSLKLQQLDDLTDPLLRSVLPTLDLSELVDLDQHFQAHCPQYSKFLPNFGNAFRSVQAVQNSSEPKGFMLRWYSDLILTLGGTNIPGRFKNMSKGFTSFSTPCFYYKDFPRRTSKMSYEVGLGEVIQGSVNFIKAAAENVSELENRMEEYLRLFIVLKQIDLGQFADLRPSLVALLDAILREQSSDLSPAVYLLMDLLLAGDISSITGPNIEGFVGKIVKSLSIEAKDFSVWNLKTLDLLLYTLKLKNIKNVDYCGVNPEDILQVISFNLTSPFKMARGLTLSILVEICELLGDSYEDLARFLQLALENEACELELATFDHLTNYIAMESCIKNVDPEAQGHQLQVMAQYLVGNLYQNHAKVMETVRNTMLPLVATRLKGTKFWETLEPIFIALHNDELANPDTFLVATRSEFLDKLATLMFGFKHSEPGAVGKEFRVDFTRQKVNLWVIVKNVGLTFPQKAQSDINACIYRLYEQVRSPPPYVGIKEDPASKEVMQILTPALEFLNCYPAKGFPGVDRRKELCLGLLLGPKSIQKSVVGILRKISPTINDFLTKIEKIGEDDWIKSAHLKPFQGPDAFYRPPDRAMYIQFILRSLLALKGETKGHCMDQVVSFIVHCTEDEALNITKFLFGDVHTWENAPRTLSTLKYLKGNMKTIMKMIPEWRFRFPSVVSYLVERVCYFIRFLETPGFDEGEKCEAGQSPVSSSVSPVTSSESPLTSSESPVTFSESPVTSSESPVTSSESRMTSGESPVTRSESIATPKNEEVPMQKRKKAILTAARSCIVNFFTLFEKLAIQSDLIDLIFQTLIWSTDASDPATYSSDSISWLFHLIMIWSRSPRYHPLFIKCLNQKPESTVISGLFDAFESKHLKSTPHVHLMEVVTNLGLLQDQEIQEDDQEMAEIPALDCGELLDINVEGAHLGEKILFYCRDRLLRVITKTDFFKDRMFLGNKTDHYINFLRLCTRFSDDAGTNHKLCNTIITLLPKFKNKPSELVGLLELVETLLKTSCPNNSIAVELSRCLTWVEEKSPREALCSAIGVSMVNKNQANLIRALNAYKVKVGDTPDFEVRQEAFAKCNQLVQSAAKFKSVFFTILANNCFFYLSHESDIGMVAASEGLLTCLAQTTQKLAAENPKIAHQFLDTAVKRLKAGARAKSTEIFGLHLKVLSAFAMNCHELHGALKGVHGIFQAEDRDLLIELQEMQLSARAKAINQFQFLWQNMREQPSTVVDFVIPMLSHYLLDKAKQKVALQNVIQCSLDALKWCVIALPHGAYFKYFQRVLESIPEEEVLLKQYHRLLGAVLDGYHYELDEGFVREISRKGKPPGEDLQSIPEGDGMEVDSSDVSKSNGETPKETEDKIEEELIVKLNYEESKSLLKTVEEKFIPKLRKYLHLEEKASHKLARLGGDTDALIKKIPTTLAYVKLLHKLPACVRKNHMLWVVPTLCSSLNSRLISVRSNVRGTLVKIVEELGPEIFPEIVRSAKAVLLRGYQKHVRNFTLLHILKQLKDSFREKPKFVPVADLVAIAEDEIFGYMAEDKDVSEILKNTPEAKAQNGLQLVHHCAMFATEEKLDLLIKCPIERAKTLKSFENIKATKAWMTEVATGLAANKNLKALDLLRFLDSKRQVYCGESQESARVKVKGKYLSLAADAFIVPVASSMKKSGPKQGAVGVVAVASWFVFSCLYNLLKREETVESDGESLRILDGMARHIVEGKNDEGLEIRTPTVRSLILLYQFELKCFREEKFVVRMWRKYFMAVNDAVSNEDINMYYKFLTSFCVTFPEFRMDLGDFSLLVKCLNRHLQDSKCTGSALVLLRNILQRSLESDDLTSLIREVKRRITNDDSVHVQEGCRAAYVVYVKNYLKNREEFMKELYDFFKTLGYRKSLQDVHSVYKMIAALITIVPDSWVSEIATTVGMDLVLALMKSNDEESQKLISNSCMKNLFERMSREDGVAFVTELEKTAEQAEMVPYQREICLTINKVIEHRKCWESEPIALKLLEILSDVLAPVTLLELQANKCKSLEARHRDFGIFEAIVASRSALGSLVTFANLTSKTSKEIQNILDLVRKNYVNYGHESIQDVSIQLINKHLELIVGAIASKAPAKIMKSEFMEPVNSGECLLRLVKDYVRFGGAFEAEDMRANVLTGLSLLARLTSFQNDKEFHAEVMKCLRVAVNIEVRKAPKETFKRDLVFNFCVHYVSEIPEECLEVIQQSLVNITTRERTDANVQDTPMAQTCASIQKKLEQRVGRQVFLELYEKSRSALESKRENNRAKKKEQVVLSMDPHSGVSFRKRKRPTNQKGAGGKKFKKNNNNKRGV